MLVALALAAATSTETILDDAGRLSATRVASVVTLAADPGEAERTLRATLAAAAADGRPVSIGGARHSMGGQALVADGIHVDTRKLSAMSLDPTRGILHVGAGARWAAIVPYLDARGFSPAVMQSYNDFSVGGSLGVNAHGWQTGKPPMAGSVEAFRIMTADGRVRRASRQENRELFALALGGYGLFGVMLDVELRVIPNERYALAREQVAPAGYAAAFARRVAADPAAGMAYGRLSVAPGSFMRECILNVFTRVPLGAGEAIPALTPADGSASDFTTWLIHRQAEAGAWKDFRWALEKLVEPQLSTTYTNRNQLLNEGTARIANTSEGSTDLLHEYFVPRDRFAEFVARCREIVPRHRANLLNVTIRDVARDDDTFLRYAPEDLFALVMYFRQRRDADGEARMAALTRDLVDAALACGGRHYLPYRLHATLGQFDRAYPQAARFFALKRRYDPGERFQNALYLRYGRP